MKRFIFISLGLLAALVTGLVVPTKAVSDNGPSNLDKVQAAPLLTRRNSRLRGARFRVRASGWRRGGLSRGCLVLNQFAAITPPFTPTSITEEDDSPAYLNASSHPILFIAVPNMPAVKGRLFVEDPEATSRSERQLYKVDFELDAQSGGVIGIRIPKEAPPLVVGQKYLWRVSLSCDANDPTDFVTFRSNGVLEVVEDITGTSDERLNYYLDEQIWQDTLTIVAEDYYSNPDNTDALSNWKDLMESNNLSQYASSRIIDIIEAELQ